jgi:hypothetical protein
LFETSDPVDHARYRRIFSPGFSQSTLDNLEDLILDSGILALMDKLKNKYADRDIACNLFNDFHLMAFDILGELAYGKSFDMIKMDSHPFPSWIKVQIYLKLMKFLYSLGTNAGVCTIIDPFKDDANCKSLT